MFQSYFQDTPTTNNDDNHNNTTTSGNNRRKKNATNIPSLNTTVPTNLNGGDSTNNNNRQLLLDDDDDDIDHDDLLHSGAISTTTRSSPYHEYGNHPQHQQQQYQRSGYRSSTGSRGGISSIPSPHPPGPFIIPPFSVTGVISAQKVVAVPHRGSDIQLQYMIYRPRNLQPISVTAAKNLPAHILASFQSNPPIVAVAGGPGMPCAYLAMPLVQTIQDRSIIVYDAYGCGKNITNSHNYKSLSGNMNHQQQKFFHLPDMVLDLKAIIESLPVQKYHLIGHSFGGIVAFEYLQLLKEQQRQQTKTNQQQQSCLSFVMSSTPSSIPDVDAHCQTLLNDIKKELLDAARTMNQKKKDTAVTEIVDSIRANTDVKEESDNQIVEDTKFLTNEKSVRNEPIVNDINQSSDENYTILHEVFGESDDKRSHPESSQESTTSGGEQTEKINDNSEDNRKVTTKDDTTIDNLSILQGMVQRAKEKTENRSTEAAKAATNDTSTQQGTNSNEFEYDEDVINILQHLDLDYDDYYNIEDNDDIGLSTVRTIRTLAQRIYFERYECRVKPIPMALQHSIEGYRVTALGNYNAIVGNDRNNLNNTNDPSSSNSMSFRQYDVRKRKSKNDESSMLPEACHDIPSSALDEDLYNLNIQKREGENTVEDLTVDLIETKVVDPTTTNAETATSATTITTTPSLLERILDNSDSLVYTDDPYHLLDEVTKSELDDTSTTPDLQPTSTEPSSTAIDDVDQVDGTNAKTTNDNGDDQSNTSSVLPKAVLLLRGQYDFVPHESIAEWLRHFSSKNTITRLLTLSNCSHYCMIENEDLYGTVISTLLLENDNR